MLIFGLINLSFSACVTPADELYVNNDTTLCSGTYTVNDADNLGLIKINASDLTLTCNNTVLDGDSTGAAIRIIESKTNVTITGCNITDYDYGIRVQTDWDGGSITNNSFSNIDYYAIDFLAAVSNITINNNSFYGGPGTSGHLIYNAGGDYLTISDNYFGLTSGDYQIDMTSGSTYNNITNNTFNSVGSTQHSLYVYSNSATNNNKIWKNIFLGRGVAITDSLAGRTEAMLQYNSFCVDGIGNAYFNMTSSNGLERPLQDCGPFSNMSVISINQSYDGNWEWDGTTSGVDVNFTSIADAVANAPHGALVNVTTPTTQTEGIIAYYLDNLTLDCNNIGTIDNGAVTGNGIELRYLYNFTVQNCSIDQFDQGLYLDYIYNSSFLNNTLTNGNDESHLGYSNYNTFENNSFFDILGANHAQLQVLDSNYNTIKNNLFNSTDDHLYIYQSSYDCKNNNITGNIFDTAGTLDALRITESALAFNNSIWKNTFYKSGVYIGDDLAGRDDLGIANNNWCVDDGSGAVGNAYLGGSGHERPLQDCGPFPSLSSVSVNPAYDNKFEFGGTTNGVTVNMSNIQDAVANVNSNARVDVTAAGTFTEEVISWYRDNVTLDCNNIGIIDNGAITGHGIDLRFLYNYTVQNCSIDQFDQGLYLDYIYNSSFLNNTLTNGNDESHLGYSNYNTFENNSFFDIVGANHAQLQVLNSNYNTIKNNLFNSTDDHLYIYQSSYDCKNNNITGNIFDTAGTLDALRITESALAFNNSIWKNTFYKSGVYLADSLAGRSALGISTNNWCVDDGSGAVGNAYLGGSGHERPLQDCGPFPSLSSVSVNPAYDNKFEFGGTTNGVTVNMSNIQDAVANVNSNARVDVTAAGTFTEEVISWYRDNVTLDCNNIGIIDNGAITGHGIDLRFLYNYTVQNCSIDQFDQGLYLDYIYNSSFLNNTLTNGYDESHLGYSNYNTFENNSFFDILGANHAQLQVLNSNYNTIKNNLFNSTDDHLYIYQSTYDCKNNNITGNIFDTAGTLDALRITESALAFNNSIWKNTFYKSGVYLADSLAGRSALGISTNNWCVDDGSGAVGNAYLGGSGHERPLQDCGPFPSLSSVSVNPAYDNKFEFGGTTNGVTVNMSNIQDAVANVNSNARVDVTAAGTFTEEVISWYRDNVTLDCNNIGIIDNGAITGHGIDLRFLYNFTVQNCSIDQYEYSVWTAYIYNSSFINNTFSNADDRGVHLSYTDYFLVENNTFLDVIGTNEEQLYTSTCNYGQIKGNLFSSPDDLGYYLYYYPSKNINVTENIFNLSSVNFYMRLYTNAANTGTVIWANDFIGKDTMDVDSYSTYSFNRSNVGNYWRNHDSQGEGCIDLSPVDGICDSSYEVETGSSSYDYYPRTDQLQITPDCGEVIDTSTTLTSDLLNSTGGNLCPQHGLIINASDIVLDCAGHSINGQNASNTYGVYVGSFSNVTIKNCMIDPYEYGILLNGTTASIVENNTINDTAGAGIWVINSANNNTLRNNELISNSVGVNLTGATNTLVYYNNFTNSTVLQAYSDSATNLFNITNGTSCALCARGNNWSDIFSNSINISDSNSDDYGDTGAEYPYSSSDRGNVSSNIIDYGPWVGDYIPPVPQVPPVAVNVTLNSTLGTNTTDENLTLYYDTYDSNGQEIQNITNWFLDDTSIAVLNLPFENGTSNSTWTKDYSSRGHDGTVNGATWNSTGGHDGLGAYTFDGTSDYINFGTSTDLNLRSNYTISLWVNRTKSGYQGILSRGSYTYLFAFDNSNYLAYFNSGSGWLNSDTVVSPNVWHHIALTHNGTHVTFYLDGQPDGSAATGLGQDAPANPTNIGYWASYYLGATIDDFNFFNRSLSAEQIDALYQNRTDLIVSNETSLGDVWQGCITPNAGGEDGSTVCSNNLTIQSPPPFVCGDVLYASVNFTTNLKNSTGGEVCPDYGLIANASDITIDCKGYGMSGNGGSINDNAIVVYNVSNVTIKNCNINGFGYRSGVYQGQIHLGHANYTTIENVNLSSSQSGAGGISIRGITHNVLIQEVNVTSNLYALDMVGDNTGSNVVRDSTLRATNSQTVVLTDADDNLFEDLNITGSSGYYLWGSTPAAGPHNNTVRRNNITVNQNNFVIQNANAYGNTLEDSYLRHTSGGNFIRAVYLSGSATVRNNTIERNDCFGDNVAELNANDVLFQDNNLSCGAWATPLLQISSGSNVTVSGNRFMGTGSNKLEIKSGVTSASISGNYFDSNPSVQSVVTDAGATTSNISFSDNIFVGPRMDLNGFHFTLSNDTFRSTDGTADIVYPLLDFNGSSSFLLSEANLYVLDNITAVDSGSAAFDQAFNSTANITMYGVNCSDFSINYNSSFVTSTAVMQGSTVVADESYIGSDCEGGVCTGIACSGTTLTFSAPSWSSFMHSNGTVPEVTEPSFNITACQEITSNGSYQLTADLEGAAISYGAAQTCVKITSDNVVLNCNSYTISNNGTTGDTYGILVDSVASNVSIIDCPMVSGYTAGTHIVQSTDVFIDPSWFCDNAIGILVNESNDTSIEDSIACNNTQYGIYVLDSDNTTVLNSRTYNNAQDFQVDNNLGNSVDLNISSLVFDRPAGDMSDYTDISLLDSVSAGGSFSMNWSSGAALPANYTSFENKFVDLSGSESIGTIVWTWTAGESIGYNESAFELQKYNGSNWSNTGAALNEGANTLTLSSHTPGSIYGIMSNATPLNVTTANVSLYGANVSNVTYNGRFNGSAAGNLSTEGGNVSGVNISSTQLTERWAAFYGDVVGNIFLNDLSGTNVYSWSWAPAAGGVVCLSTNSSLSDPTTVTGAEGVDIDNAWSLTSSATDSGNSTFSSTNCTIGIGTATISNASYADTGSAGGFRTCALKSATTPTKPDMLFCSSIISGGTLWNGAAGDYEVMVPTPEASGTNETYYFYANLN